MTKKPENRVSRFMNRIKVDSDRLESPGLHQPQVKEKRPPKVVRPSKTMAYLTTACPKR